MSISLTKGQKINLSKEVAGLSKVKVGLGWDAAKKGLFSTAPDIDCDASVLLIGSSDKYLGKVYYGDRTGANGCVKHRGDNLTGVGIGDDEVIDVDLKNMPSDVEKVVFVVNIYNCAARKQHFGMIKNAYIRLEDTTTKKEICKYNLTDNYDKKTAMIFGEIYKHNNEWKMNAIGQGTEDTSISDIVRRYR